MKNGKMEITTHEITEQLESLTRKKINTTMKALCRFMDDHDLSGPNAIAVLGSFIDMISSHITITDAPGVSMSSLVAQTFKDIE